jgi:hypothetical protein
MPERPSSRRAPDGWTRAELAVLRRLRTPAHVQDFLDGIAYRAEDAPACPRRVLRERRAHCYDGALFAAAALRLQGHPPLLVDLQAVRDDDHVLAVFRRGGRWGAVAKSNFAGLRYRDPIHRSVRELAASYFEAYFNLQGEKTLRRHSVPFDLSRLDRLRWTFDETHLDAIAGRLDASRHHPLLARGQERTLRPVDARSMRAGMVGTDMAGVHGAR